jgi:hypothetical protein
VVTDLDTGATTGLASKARSRCSFFERFSAGGYEVQLRLDWADLDARGNPPLDADFIDPVTGIHDRRMLSHAAHHTAASATGERTYVWRLDTVQRRFTVAVTWSVALRQRDGDVQGLGGSFGRLASLRSF